MNKYKKFIGLVVDNKVIDGIESYYDFSTDNKEYAFYFQNSSLAINCELFINKHF